MFVGSFSNLRPQDVNHWRKKTQITINGNLQFHTLAKTHCWACLRPESLFVCCCWFSIIYLHWVSLVTMPSLTHKAELIDQNYSRWKEVYCSYPSGKYQTPMHTEKLSYWSTAKHSTVQLKSLPLFGIGMGNNHLWF